MFGPKKGTLVLSTYPTITIASLLLLVEVMIANGLFVLLIRQQYSTAGDIDSIKRPDRATRHRIIYEHGYPSTVQEVEIFDGVQSDWRR